MEGETMKTAKKIEEKLKEQEIDLSRKFILMNVSETM